VWRDVMAPTSEAHFKVIAPNLFGFASSEHKQAEYSIAYQAQAIAEFIDRLKLDHVNLVGHDLGADVALYYAVTHPDSVERLILVSGGLVGSKGAASLRDNLLPNSPAAMRSQVALSFFDLPPMPDFVYQRMLVDLAADLSAETGMLDSVGKDEGQIRARLGQIFNTLTIIIWGDQDKIVPRSDGDALHSLLPGSATVLFKESGHVPQLEHPDEFVESLIYLLKQKEGGR
jgi:pimeloyl-ACP methyl ester carboxylesterase